jgi:cytochrome oxidase Cu insertion factor (SCO1/SenC/PrrC family)
MNRIVFSALLGISLYSSVAFGQLTRDGVMQGFDRKAPEVGEALPDLRAYNAAGEAIQLAELKGNYTVLVFGCLT